MQLAELRRRLEDRRLDAFETVQSIESVLGDPVWQARFAPIARATRALEFATARDELERLAGQPDVR